MPQDMERWLEELVRLTDEDEPLKMTEKQAKIVQAAVEIFAEKGYAATSTSEIAQRAGVAEGTIFRHYKTKKELLLAIAGPIVTKLVTPFLLRDFTKVLDLPYERAEDFFRAVAKNRIAFARAHMPYLRIFIHEVPFHPELQAQVQAVFTDQVYRRLEKIIRHFQDAGQLIEAPPWRIVRSSISIMVGLILFHVLLRPQEDWDEDEEIDRTLELLFHGIAAARTQR